MLLAILIREAASQSIRLRLSPSESVVVVYRCSALNCRIKYVTQKPKNRYPCAHSQITPPNSAKRRLLALYLALYQTAMGNHQPQTKAMIHCYSQYISALGQDLYLLQTYHSKETTNTLQSWIITHPTS